MIGESRPIDTAALDPQAADTKPSKREKRLARTEDDNKTASTDANAAELQAASADSVVQHHPVWKVNRAAYNTASRIFGPPGGDEAGEVRWSDIVTVSKIAQSSEPGVLMLTLLFS
jgi:hypothetical protein